MKLNKEMRPLYIASVLSFIFMCGYFAFSFVHIMKFGDLNLNLFEIAFPTRPEIVKTTAAIAIALIFAIIALIMIISLPLLSSISGIKKNVLLLISCLSLPLLAFSFAINFLIVPLFKNANNYAKEIDPNHFFIVLQCVFLFVTIISLIFAIFYIAIKDFSYNGFERKKISKLEKAKLRKGKYNNER